MKRKTKLPSNWRSRLVLIKEVEDCSITYQLRFVKGKTPKGFSNYIGEFIIDDNYIHCNISEYFQNRGLGTLCYRTILHDRGELNTHYHSASDQAKAVWNKLIKLYDYETDFWTSTLKIELRPEEFGSFVGIPIVS